MIGETAFSLALWPRSPLGGELLQGWERFALPIVDAPASGGGESARTGSLLAHDLDVVQLSNVRRHDGRTEVRVWNADLDPVRATIGNVAADLGGAEIRTVAI
jgi:hypothetical protein